jgi:hypothetical protein
MRVKADHIINIRDKAHTVDFVYSELSYCELSYCELSYSEYPLIVNGFFRTDR